MVKADTQRALAELLRSLRKQYNETAAAFGVRLGAATGSAKPYSYSYVLLMEKQRVGISAVVARALHALAGLRVMVTPGHGAIVSPGALVLLSERQCKNQACGRPFIGHHFRLYCSDACRAAASKRTKS